MRDWVFMTPAQVGSVRFAIGLWSPCGKLPIRPAFLAAPAEAQAPDPIVFMIRNPATGRNKTIMWNAMAWDTRGERFRRATISAYARRRDIPPRGVIAYAPSSKHHAACTWHGGIAWVKPTRDARLTVRVRSRLAIAHVNSRTQFI